MEKAHLKNTDGDFEIVSADGKLHGAIPFFGQFSAAPEGGPRQGRPTGAASLGLVYALRIKSQSGQRIHQLVRPKAIGIGGGQAHLFFDLGQIGFGIGFAVGSARESARAFI